MISPGILSVRHTHTFIWITTYLHITICNADTTVGHRLQKGPAHVTSFQVILLSGFSQDAAFFKATPTSPSACGSISGKLMPSWTPSREGPASVPACATTLQSGHAFAHALWSGVLACLSGLHAVPLSLTPTQCP